MTAGEIEKGPIFGARHLQTLLLFLSIVISYSSRLNIAISLVAMTDAKTTNPNFHEFDWDEKEKSYILSSFFWGYTLLQFPGGYAARRLGAKKAIFISVLGSSLFMLIIPFCILWGGWQIFCVIRTLQGMFQGILFPCVYQHLAKWSPIEERNRLGGLTHTGIECGTILAMYLTGTIAASDMGWPGISYVFSGLGMIFCIIWMIFAENCPAEAKFITSVERNYILKSQGNVQDEQSKEIIQIPWKAMVTSVPLISLLVVRLCDTWGYATMQSQIPAYLHGALKMDINNNSLFSALPYVTMWVFSYVFLISADIVLKNKWTSLLVVRKTLNTIAMWGPAILLLGIGFLNENQKALATIFITLNVGLNAGHVIGSLLNLIDLSPNHASIVMGVANTLASIISIISPIVVGIVVNDETQRSQWQIILSLSAVIFILGNLQYLFFAQTDAQPWDAKDFMTKHDSEKSMAEIKIKDNNSVYVASK